MFWGLTPEAWTAFAAVAYDVLTLLLIIGAIANYVVLRKQVQVAKEAAADQLAEARRLRMDAVRPHLFLDGVTLLPGAMPVNGQSLERAVELRLRNVGRGAAINVHVEAWVKPVPPGTLPGRRNLWDPFLAEFVAEYERRTTAPSATLDVMGIGESTDQIACLMVENSIIVPGAKGAEVALVLARIRCADQYGCAHQFPAASEPGEATAHWRLAQLEIRPPVLP